MNEHSCVPIPFYLQQPAKGWIWPIGSYLLNHGLQCERKLIMKDRDEMIHVIPQQNFQQNCCCHDIEVNRVPSGFGDLAEGILKS